MCGSPNPQRDCIGDRAFQEGMRFHEAVRAGPGPPGQVFLEKRALSLHVRTEDSPLKDEKAVRRQLSASRKRVLTRNQPCLNLELELPACRL